MFSCLWEFPSIVFYFLLKLSTNNLLKVFFCSVLYFLPFTKLSLYHISLLLIVLLGLLLRMYTKPYWFCWPCLYFSSFCSPGVKHLSILCNNFLLVVDFKPDVAFYSCHHFWKVNVALLRYLTFNILPWMPGLLALTLVWLLHDCPLVFF